MASTRRKYSSLRGIVAVGRLSGVVSRYVATLWMSCPMTSTVSMCSWAAISWKNSRRSGDTSVKTTIAPASEAFLSTSATAS